MTILQLGKQKERIEKVIYTDKKNVKKKVHSAPAAVVRRGQNQKKNNNLAAYYSIQEGKGTRAGSRNFRENMHLERVGRVGTGRSAAAAAALTCTWSRCTQVQ